MSRIPLSMGTTVAAVALAVMSGAPLAFADTNLGCYEITGVKDPLTGDPFYACDPLEGNE